MTISYGDNFGLLLITRWRGSIWKSVWKELVIWLILYYIVRVVYRELMGAAQQEAFEDIAIMFDSYSKSEYITFILGFYIGKIVERWWEQFQKVPWTDRMMSTACYIFDGDNEEHQLMRHTIARYLNLTSVLAWRKISAGMHKLFPTVETAVQCGLMTEHELKLYKAVPHESNRWYMPLQWIENLMHERRRELNLPPPIERDFLVEVNAFRQGWIFLGFHDLFCYDWVCIPLVYTNVATLATYAFFIFSLISRQFLIPEKGYECCKVDFYVPIFTITQFLFYVGWCKVGQDLMRPFGLDDDDIDVLAIFRRNLRVSFNMAHGSNRTPQPTKDALWHIIYERATPPAGSTRSERRHDEGGAMPNGVVSSVTVVDKPAEQPNPLRTDVTSSLFRRIGRSSLQGGDIMF